MITEAKFVIEPSEFIEMISEASLSYRHYAIFAKLSDDRLEFFNPDTLPILCYHTLTDTRISTIRLYDSEPVLIAIDAAGTRDIIKTAGIRRKAHIYLQRSPGDTCATQVVSQQQLQATTSVELNPRSTTGESAEKPSETVKIKQVPETRINYLRDSFDLSGQWNPPNRDSEGFLRLETHINELERIIDLEDYVNADKKLKDRKYPVKFCDDQLLLDYEDKNRGNRIEGNLLSEEIRGPDYYYHYGKSFRSLVKRLSGPVELHIAPNGDLAMIKRKHGSILRYMIPPKDKES
jgi:DNA-dependent RNA polymerase auxiliary subunit epsilon